MNTTSSNILDWVPSSPNMNIIEHFWDQIDHFVQSHHPLPHNGHKLWGADQEEWEKFPQDALEKLYESMLCCFAVLVAAWVVIPSTENFIVRSSSIHSQQGIYSNLWQMSKRIAHAPLKYLLCVPPRFV